MIEIPKTSFEKIKEINYNFDNMYELLESLHNIYSYKIYDENYLNYITQYIKNCSINGFIYKEAKSLKKQVIKKFKKEDLSTPEIKPKEPIKQENKSTVKIIPKKEEITKREPKIVKLKQTKVQRIREPQEREIRPERPVQVKTQEQKKLLKVLKVKEVYHQKKPGR